MKGTLKYNTKNTKTVECPRCIEGWHMSNTGIETECKECDVKGVLIIHKYSNLCMICGYVFKRKNMDEIEYNDTKVLCCKKCKEWIEEEQEMPDNNLFLPF